MLLIELYVCVCSNPVDPALRINSTERCRTIVGGYQCFLLLNCVIIVEKYLIIVTVADTGFVRREEGDKPLRVQMGAYNGGLGAEPVGSRGRGGGHGYKGPEAESFLFIFIQKRGRSQVFK